MTTHGLRQSRIGQTDRLCGGKRHNSKNKQTIIDYHKQKMTELGSFEFHVGNPLFNRSAAKGVGVTGVKLPLVSSFDLGHSSKPDGTRFGVGCKSRHRKRLIIYAIHFLNLFDAQQCVDDRIHHLRTGHLHIDGPLDGAALGEQTHRTDIDFQVVVDRLCNAVE